jgi:hypothetical protein
MQSQNKFLIGMETIPLSSCEFSAFNEHLLIDLWWVWGPSKNHSGCSEGDGLFGRGFLTYMRRMHMDIVCVGMHENASAYSWDSAGFSARIRRKKHILASLSAPTMRDFAEQEPGKM